MKVNVNKLYFTLLIVVMMSLLLAPMSAFADVRYYTFTNNKFGHTLWIQPAYYPVEIIGTELYIADPNDPEIQIPSPLNNPQDVFIDHNDHIFIADTGNNRIVHFDEHGDWIKYITVPESPLNNPHGLFVTDEGIIYIADTGNKRVVKLNQDGNLLQEFLEPGSRFIPEGYKYDPIKLVVDRRGFIYITTLGGYQGLLQLNPDGEFSSFYGTNLTNMTLIDQIKRAVYTREMWENEISKVPGVIRNVAVDHDGFIYTVTAGLEIKTEQVKKLNIEGLNILGTDEKKSYGELPPNEDFRSNKTSVVPQLVDVAVDINGNITVIEGNYSVISQYDRNGNLLFYWVGSSNTSSTALGAVRKPIAVEINSNNELFILDNQENNLQKFELTEFGEMVHGANALTMEGYYNESVKLWSEVLHRSAYFGPAVEGLALAAYKSEDFQKATQLFTLSGNQDGYSDAFWQLRLEWFQRNFSWIATSSVIIFFIAMSFGKLTRNMKWRKKWLHRKKSEKSIIIQLKHALYMLKHPIDGMSALREENKGSYLSAIIILIFTLIALVFSQIYTSFTFNLAAPFKVNIFNTSLSFFIIWLGWVVCNYLISSIYQGEGRFKDVFIGSAYALTPLIIVGIPLAIISNIMTNAEMAIYEYIYYGMIVWVGLFYFWMVQVTQNYSIKETVYNIFLSIVAMIILGVLVFIMIFLTNEFILFIYEIYQEVSLR